MVQRLLVRIDTPSLPFSVLLCFSCGNSSQNIVQSNLPLPLKVHLDLLSRSLLSPGGAGKMEIECMSAQAKEKSLQCVSQHMRLPYYSISHHIDQAEFL